MQLLFRANSPDTFKEMQDDEFAPTSLGEFRNPDQSAEPASISDLRSLRKEMYDLTQAALKDLPNEVTVYRHGELNKEDGLSSFSLDPNIRNPWQFGRTLNNRTFQSYKANKSDILVAPDLIRDFQEEEVIIKNNKVRDPKKS